KHLSVRRSARYPIHDRDSAFYAWTSTGAAIRIEEILTAPRSPWQNAYAERLIGSIRRECLDHIIVASERRFRRPLHAYVAYYLKCRTHLSLAKDTLVSRPIATPTDGAIVATPHLGGLHHHYERRAASPRLIDRTTHSRAIANGSCPSDRLSVVL